MRNIYRTSRRHFLKATSVIAGVAIVSNRRAAWAAEGDLIVRSQEPYNAEPALANLAAERITPVRHFYVRNHGPTPKLKENDIRLRIEGMVQRPLELSLAEIKARFRQETTEARLT